MIENENIYKKPTGTPDPDRYKIIESRNAESFYMTDMDRPFDAITSVYSTGGDPVARLGRAVLAGNMSPLNNLGPNELTQDERITDANSNLAKFFNSVNIDPAKVRLLLPDRDYTTPLAPVDLDEMEIAADSTGPITVSTRSDFIYTRNPDLHLAARPADCPIVIADGETNDGEQIHMLSHYAWHGAANHYVQQTGDVYKQLNINPSTLKLYISLGGQSESFPYDNYPENPTHQYPGTERLFTDIEEIATQDGPAYNFNIDTPHFVYNEFLKLGIEPRQIFLDTSDSADLESGYSSHSRSSRYNLSNTRDIIVSRQR